MEKILTVVGDFLTKSWVLRLCVALAGSLWLRFSGPTAPTDAARNFRSGVELATLLVGLTLIPDLVRGLRSLPQWRHKRREARAIGGYRSDIIDGVRWRWDNIRGGATYGLFSCCPECDLHVTMPNLRAGYIHCEMRDPTVTCPGCGWKKRIPLDGPDPTAVALRTIERNIRQKLAGSKGDA